MRRLSTLAFSLVLCAAPALADDVAAPPPAPTPPAAAAPAEAKSAASDWVADFDKAIERAKAEKKDLLVDFTGSDWCVWCQRLHEEVLVKADFLAAASKDYVLVSLDFPRSEEAKAKVPSEKRNAELQEKYAIQGFPTVLLMTADGDVFARTGYQEGGSAKYVEHMKGLRDSGRPALATALAAAKDVADAKDDTRAAAIEKALALVEGAPQDAAWTQKLVPAVRAAMDSDPENAKGVKVRAVKALFKAGLGDDALRTAAKALDPKNEKGVLELSVMSSVASVRDEEGCRSTLKLIDEVEAAGIKDPELKQVLLANAAFWNFRVLNDHDRAVAYANKLKAVADPKNARLQSLIDAILKPAEKGSGMKEEGDEEDEGDENEKGEGPEKGEAPEKK